MMPTQYQTMMNNNDNLQKRNRTLLQANRDLYQRIGTLNQENGTLRQMNKTISQEYHELQRNLTEERITYARQISNSDAECHSLKRQIAELQKKYEDSKLDIGLLQGQIDFTKANSKLNKNYSAENDVLREKLEESAKTIKRLEEINDSLKIEIDTKYINLMPIELENENAELRNELAKINQKLAKSEEEKIRLIGARDMYERENVCLKSELESKITELSQEIAKCTAATTTIDTRDAEISRIVGSILKNNAKHEAEQKELDSKNSEILDKLAACETENAVLVCKIAKYEAAEIAFTTAINTLKEVIAQRDAIITKYNELETYFYGWQNSLIKREHELKCATDTHRQMLGKRENLMTLIKQKISENTVYESTN
jgi:chromosome segregation ATPase